MGFAFELISAPKKKNDGSFERTKFILIPDLDVDENKQRLIRDKWVKSLRLATKGAFLWDVLLNLQVTMTTTASPHSHEQINDYSRQATDESSSSSLYPHHSL